jgi:hypothetical protein
MTIVKITNEDMTENEETVFNVDCFVSCFAKHYPNDDRVLPVLNLTARLCGVLVDKGILSEADLLEVVMPGHPPRRKEELAIVFTSPGRKAISKNPDTAKIDELWR